jgi:uncharacterized protein DUF4360
MLLLLIAALSGASVQPIEIPIVGAITDVSGAETCPNRTIKVANLEVALSGQTDIQNASCPELTRGDHVTIAAIDDGRTLKAKTVVLPGPVDADARRLVRRFGRVIGAPVVNLSVPAESVAPVSDTAFGESVGICVGKIDGSKPIDIVLFVPARGGAESIEPGDDCSLIRKDVSYRQLVAVALSSTQRFAVFEHFEHSYLLNINIRTHLLHKDEIVLDVYEMQVNPRPSPGSTPAPPVMTPPVVAAPAAAALSGITWSTSCVTDDVPPTFTLTQGRVVIRLHQFAAEIQRGHRDEQSRTCRLYFDLALPDGFRATFAAAQYQLRVNTIGKGRGDVRIRHGISDRSKDRGFRWSKPFLLTGGSAAQVATVDDPPRSACGGTRHFAVDLRVHASTRDPNDAAMVNLDSVDVNAGAPGNIVLEKCH